MQSKSIELQPTIRIPDLPAAVKYTEPQIPEVADDAKGTSKAIDNYEKANEANKFAIEQAQKHNRSLQRIYNKKKAKEKTKDSEKSSWNLFKF